jgi:hypothetical protein
MEDGGEVGGCHPLESWYVSQYVTVCVGVSRRILEISATAQIVSTHSNVVGLLNNGSLINCLHYLHYIKINVLIKLFAVSHKKCKNRFL